MANKKVVKPASRNVKKTTTKKKVNRKRVVKKKKESLFNKLFTQRNVSIFVIFMIGVLLIFSSYAWFSTSLNVKIKEFNMIVSRNSGLSISFDGINFDTAIEISRDSLINNLTKTYPNHVNQWAAVGLTPVSSNGISNSNSYFFDIFASSGVRYKNKQKTHGYINTIKVIDTKPRSFNYYIAFDIFFKNETGSPVADNLYFDEGTTAYMTSDSGDEMQGLVNSLRIGIVKVGTVPLGSDASTIQNMQCNNNCKSIIFEPNSTAHTMLSRERAAKYDLDLRDGEQFPTFAMIKAGGPIYVEDNVSGSSKLDYNYFALQKTIKEDDFEEPLFTVPDGITKARVYLWIEGQDIDSLETDSTGADIYVDINFVKDTNGYQAFN